MGDTMETEPCELPSILGGGSGGWGQGGSPVKGQPPEPGRTSPCSERITGPFADGGAISVPCHPHYSNRLDSAPP